MNKARETRERHTDKFHNSMSSLGFEPPNHGVTAIIIIFYSRVIICKFPVKLPFPVHSGLQRASKSRHVHSNGVPGRLAAGIPSSAHVSIRIRSIHPIE